MDRMDRLENVVLVMGALYLVVILLFLRLGGRGKTWAAAILAGLLLLIMVVIWAVSGVWFILLLGVAGAVMLFVSWRYVLPRDQYLKKRQP
jgi:zinc transporter ZupT